VKASPDNGEAFFMPRIHGLPPIPIRAGLLAMASVNVLASSLASQLLQETASESKMKYLRASESSPKKKPHRDPMGLLSLQCSRA